MDAVSEIKARLNIEDVVSEYLQLKRSGRNFKAISPFTNEKTPSFMISPQKQIWHDFSSGKGGDIFSFVIEMEGLDFRGALELLARRAGVDLEPYRSSGRNSGQLKARTLEILELATKFYQRQLTANKTSLGYLLKDRQFSKPTLLVWRLGYSPNTGYALTDFLTKHGYTTDEVKLAGLITERRQAPADMFRGRIMIPLTDSRGSVVGFTARLLESEDEQGAPKYINTPQTLVYDKSRQVFGLHLAKEAIRKEGFVVAVEGNMDVIASWQAGVGNVVASAGTAMTEGHLRQLKRFTGDIRLCFDADRAGVSATERVIPIAQKVGVELRIISLVGAKDPDELIRKDIDKWRSSIKSAKYALDWLIDHYRKNLDLKTAPGKKAFSDALLPVIRRLSDPVEQEHYLKRLAKLTDTSLEAIRAKFTLAAGSSKVLLRKPKFQPAQLDKQALEYQKLQSNFLALSLMLPKLRGLLIGMPTGIFNDGPTKKVFSFLKANPAFKGDANLAAGLQEVGDYVKILSLQFEELYADLPQDDLEFQAAQLKHRLIDWYVKSQKQSLAASMKATSDEKELQRLIKRANQLNQLIKSGV